MATLVDAGGAKYPAAFNGYKIIPLEGRSLIPAFDNQPTWDAVNSKPMNASADEYTSIWAEPGRRGFIDLRPHDFVIWHSYTFGRLKFL